MVRVSFFQELADNRRFEERFVIILKCRHKTTRVEVDQGLGLVVWVHFDVLVGDLLFFQDGPGSLDEGAARWRFNGWEGRRGEVDVTYNQPEYSFKGSSF